MGYINALSTGPFGQNGLIADISHCNFILSLCKSEINHLNLYSFYMYHALK